MITTINEFRKIFELRQQHVIPFEEPEYASISVHKHILDALNDLSVMPIESYKSHGNAEDKIEQNEDAVFKKIIDTDDTTLDEYITGFVHMHGPDTDADLYNDQFLEENKDFLSDTYEIAERANEESSIDKVFSIEGKKKFLDLARSEFDNRLENMRYTITDSYDQNDGLIECWRTVMYTTSGDNDYYVNIMKYAGVGIYWSWDKDSAHAHWGHDGHTITLHGFVSVEDVDWPMTLQLNAGHLTEEREIRMLPNSRVMIVGFNDETIDKYVKLERKIIVKTGESTRP